MEKHAQARPGKTRESAGCAIPDYAFSFSRNAPDFRMPRRLYRFRIGFRRGFKALAATGTAFAAFFAGVRQTKLTW